MAKLIFKLNSVPYDEADDIKNLLTDNQIDFYETPPGNWEISLHGLWLNDETQCTQAKQLIDEYQLKRSQRIRLETQQQKDKGEFETFFQRLINRPVQFIIILAIILFILYLTIMPFVQMGQA
jgi:nucleosome binding factor SPN SPT16 subunit